MVEMINSITVANKNLPSVDMHECAELLSRIRVISLFPHFLEFSQCSQDKSRIKVRLYPSFQSWHDIVQNVKAHKLNLVDKIGTLLRGFCTAAKNLYNVFQNILSYIALHIFMRLTRAYTDINQGEGGKFARSAKKI